MLQEPRVEADLGDGETVQAKAVSASGKGPQGVRRSERERKCSGEKAGSSVGVVSTANIPGTFVLPFPSCPFKASMAQFSSWNFVT